LGGEALKEQFGVTVTIATPGGAVACLEALIAGDIHMANVAEPAVIQALTGAGVWEGNPQPNNFRGLEPRDLQENAVVVRADSDIMKMSDLMGKKVFYGHPGTSCNANMKMAMVALGYDEDIEEYVGSLSDGVAAMKDRRIDAYVKTTRGEFADPTHTDIAITQDLRVITFTKEEVDKINETYFFIPYRQLRSDAYTKITPMEVVGEGWINTDKAPTVTRVEMPEEWAYAWVTHVINNWDVLVPLMEVMGTFDPKDYPSWALDTAQACDYYLHPGAVRAYRDFGIDVPDKIIPPEMK
jgi:hypothetical protein